jgi:uncharacterized protein (DUF433 family)
MSASFEELEREIAKLTPADKARLLQILVPAVTHTWAGIEHSPDVSGGDACLVRTRIPVWLLERYRRLGWTDAKILENFPTLRAVDLANAWAYGDAHLDEIAQAMQADDAA